MPPAAKLHFFRSLTASYLVSRSAYASIAAVTWSDALDLGISGQPFPYLTGALAYTRLPPEARATVPGGVWQYSQHSSGLYVLFDTDASAVYLNYTLTNPQTSTFTNFPPIGMSGCDLLLRDDNAPGDGGEAYRWVASTFDGLGASSNGHVLEAPLFSYSAGWPVGPAPSSPTVGSVRRYRLNLPSYNGVSQLSIGVPTGATLAGVPRSPAAARVLAYGTSITQGGVTARPGQKWTSRLAVTLGVEVVNEGFCGSCTMDTATVGFIANATLPQNANASLLIVDCAWNMSPEEIAARTEPLVRQVRAVNPTVKILLMEPTPYFPAWALGDGQFNNSGRSAELEAAYQRLLAAGVSNLFYAEGDKLYSGATRDPTFEGTHPHDHGHALIAKALAPIVAGILSAPIATDAVGSLRPQAPDAQRAEPRAAPALLPSIALPQAPPANAVWLPATSLALRGRAFNNTPTPFNRLPSDAHGVVRDAVWGLGLNSPNLVVGFATSSPNIYVNYTAQDAFYPMTHFSISGVSGMELFSFDETSATWKHVQPLQLGEGTNTYLGTVCSGVLPTPSGKPRRWRLYLPLYNNPTALAVGVDAGETLVADEPYPVEKQPIVWYGTSIQQGGVSFKAANAFTNIVANNLDRTVFNFAFSGNCKLETSVAEFFTRVEAPAAVLIDCNRNEDAAGVNASAVPLVQFIRAKPGYATVPIVLVEGTGFGRDWAVAEAAADSAATDGALRAAFETLQAAGDANLHYVTQQDLWADSLDSPCANGLHPTDVGMTAVADFMTSFLAGLLPTA